MMQFTRILCGMLFAVLMTACGGGGGSPGTVPGVTPPAAAKPTITLDIIGTSGAVTSTVSDSTTTFARATVRDASGALVDGAVVTFASDSGLVALAPATALTGATGVPGVAIVQILPASTSTGGAGVLSADATVGTTAATQALYSFQVPQGTPDTPTARVTDFVLLLDKSTLSSAGTATAKLTVTAVDANNNVVSEASVNVATDSNTIFTPGGATTNAAGQYTGTIGTGGDKSNRTVVVTVTINGIVKQTSLQIAGSQVAITFTPAILSPGGSSVVTARVIDGASVVIPNVTVTFTGDIAELSNRQVVTDSSGMATVSFLAPGTVGSYLVKAAASGVSSEVTVQVGSSGAIPAAIIPTGAKPSLAAIPNVVAPNLTGTSNQSQLKFLFLDASNRPIPNVRVRFNVNSIGLGSFDSTISTGTTMVYTNASGVATASFIPGATGSPTDGVKVRACYSATDFAASACPNNVVVNLTIASEALAVSVGDDNLLAKGSGTYIKQFVVTVADSAGRAVPNAPVDLSLDITHYGKGLFEQAITFPLNIAESRTYVPNATTDPAAFGFRVSCINEDLNRNGFVDTSPDENINDSVDSFGQPTLEPRRSDIILSYVDPDVRETDASGVLLIQIQYSQRFATWLAYRIRATTTVSGSQGNAERAFITNYVVDDEANGSFRTAPYGVEACDSAN